MLYPYVFSAQGEWIGWVTADREVYSVHGHYAGYLSISERGEPRILRKREIVHGRKRLTPPAPPAPIRPPAHFPLAPQLPEIMLNTIDVLEEAPELLPSMDYGDLRDDMD